MRRHFLRLVVLLLLVLLVECLVFASEIRLVGTEGATIVVPDDFPTIQEAINNSVEGDTIFVTTGVYYEHVVVNRSVSIVGEDVDTTILDGNNTGHVMNVVSDNVTISGFTVQRAGSIDVPDLDAGICLNSAADCVVSGNRLIDNGFCGISLLNSQRNMIIENNVTNSGWGGIHLLTSSHNIVSRNIVDNMYAPINGHASSHYNNITENVISNSTYGMFYHNAKYNNILRNSLSDIAVEGIELQDQVSDNIVANNTLTNCSVAIKLLGPNYRNIVSGNILTNGQSGIRIQNARYTEIYNNTIAYNYGDEWDAGIRLDSSSDSIIHSNLIVDNWRGILLYTSSPHVSIYGNTITDNEFGVRVASGGSNYLNVSDNIVTNNRGYGIGLTGFGGASNYATISRNLIANNSDGIALGQYSSYNTITQNNITQNDYGFYMEYSTQNTIWANNIIGNNQQVNVSAGSINNWDNGYPSGGNYWSDYDQPDEYQGSAQNITGSDGIGDAPYVIDESNQDNYPRMKIWKPSILGDINGDGIVDIFDVVSVSLAFGTSQDDSNWNQAADLNNDDTVDIFDVVLLAQNFGKTA